MSRPLSQLLYTTVQTGSDTPPVITMHGYNQHGPDVSAWGRAASPNGTVTALESYKGVFVGKEIEGYTWWMGPDSAPSPLYFGDSLAEVERFLWDYLDRSGTTTLPFLVGVGQGGIMALATALAVPDLLSGVIAADAFLPQVSGWRPPLAPMNQLPVLLLNPAESDAPKVLTGDALAEQLRAWDAHVDILHRDGDSPAQLGLHEWIAHHDVRHLAPRTDETAAES